MRVVFWNDAAERNDARETDTSRIPMTNPHAHAPRLSPLAARLFGLFIDRIEVRLAEHIARRELGIAALANTHAAEHLPDDDLEVLGRNVGALELIDFDDFLNDVALGFFLA